MSVKHTPYVPQHMNMREFSWAALLLGLVMTMFASVAPVLMVRSLLNSNCKILPPRKGGTMNLILMRVPTIQKKHFLGCRIIQQRK